MPTQTLIPALRLFSPHLVKQAVSEAHQRAARLLVFSTCTMFRRHWRVSEAQSLSALDDLLAFALYSRRAIDLLQLRGEFEGLELLIGQGPLAEEYTDDPTCTTKITFLDLLGRILHANRLGISVKDTTVTHLLQRGDYQPHHFWVASDRPGDFIVHLESFILTYVERIEPRINDVLFESGITPPTEPS